MLMQTRSLFAAILLASLATCPTAGRAASFTDETPFSQSAFDAATQSGKPILVHVTAGWCTTCAAQKPILEKLRAEPKFKSMAVFNIDFDGQKKLVKAFGARMQSTLIVFKGGKEVGRSSGETEPDAIADLLGKAV